MGLEIRDAATSDARELITAVINQIGQGSHRSVAIVIDDVHAVAERSVHELLEYLLDHLPPNLHLVIACRHDPPMALAKRRARGEVTDIRLPDLSFTEEETGSLVNQRLELKSSDREISLLHARTEGWAAGLRLLATSLSQGPANRMNLLQSGMQGSRRIFDFLRGSPGSPGRGPTALFA